ncbi:MAG: FAD-linked oxidase C-terminal domain-containing protein, partial [Alphaproteobacteria bacterium]
DGTIPRHKLPEVLARMSKLSDKYELGVANVFHAGDGNLHPLIMYDANIPGQLERAEDFGSDILRLCVEVGGVLTGEHGVGVEKRDLMTEVFTEDDLKQRQAAVSRHSPFLSVIMVCTQRARSFHFRHARTCSGYPRPSTFPLRERGTPTWMAGTSPAMTVEEEAVR